MGDEHAVEAAIDSVSRAIAAEAATAQAPFAVDVWRRDGSLSWGLAGSKPVGAVLVLRRPMAPLNGEAGSGAQAELATQIFSTLQQVLHGTAPRAAGFDATLVRAGERSAMLVRETA